MHLMTSLLVTAFAATYTSKQFSQLLNCTHYPYSTLYVHCNMCTVLYSPTFYLYTVDVPREKGVDKEDLANEI